MLVTGFIEPRPASDLFKVRNGYFASPTYIVLERGGRRDWGRRGGRKENSTIQTSGLVECIMHLRCNRCTRKAHAGCRWGGNDGRGGLEEGDKVEIDFPNPMT